MMVRFHVYNYYILWCSQDKNDGGALMMFSVYIDCDDASLSCQNFKLWFDLMDLKMRRWIRIFTIDIISQLLNHFSFIKQNNIYVRDDLTHIQRTKIVV